MSDDVVFEGAHCTLAIRRPAPAVLVVELRGHDVGDLREHPFREMEKDFAHSKDLELFIDARLGRGTVDASSEWGVWLRRHKNELRQVSMLAGSRFIQMSADFVRKFAELGDRMHIYSDPSVFDGALAHAIASARAANVRTA